MCAFSWLLFPVGFLLSDFTGINQKHCAKWLYILLDKQKGCWTCTIVCLWSHMSLNKCEGHGFVKSLWISRLQVSLLIIWPIGILSGHFRDYYKLLLSACLSDLKHSKFSSLSLKGGKLLYCHNPPPHSMAGVAIFFFWESCIIIWSAQDLGCDVCNLNFQEAANTIK